MSLVDTIPVPPMPTVSPEVLQALSQSLSVPVWLTRFRSYNPGQCDYTVELYIYVRLRIFQAIADGLGELILDLRHDLIREGVLNHQNNGLFFTVLAEVRRTLDHHAAPAH